MANYKNYVDNEYERKESRLINTNHKNYMMYIDKLKEALFINIYSNCFYFHEKKVAVYDKKKK
jgi:hypothetical protein